MRQKKLLGIVLVLLCSMQLVIAKDGSGSQKLSGDSRINMRSGNTYMNIGEYDKALERYLDVVSDKPEYIEALKLIGDIYFFYGDENPLEAVPNYTESFHYYDRATIAYEKYSNVKGVKKLEKQIDDAKLKKIATWARLFNHGQENVAKQEYDSALEEFQKLAELTPDSTKIYIMLASIHQAKDEGDTAAEYFQKITEMDESDVVSRKNLAIHYFQEQDYENALKWYERVIALEPEEGDNYFWAAVVLMSSNELEKSLTYFEKAYELDNDNLDAMQYAANVAINLKQMDKAVLYFQNMVEGDPENEELLLNLLYTMSGTEDFKGMVEYGQKLYNLNNQSVEAVQFVVLGARKIDNKELEKKFIKILEQLSK
ncbi:MAG: tetratricopeptide repeat protein [Candidatus Cloacimonadia bacterium]